MELRSDLSFRPETGHTRASDVGATRHCDNTFRCARDLGRIRSFGRTVFRRSGSLSRFDRVDFYKFTAPPGTSVRLVFEQYRNQRGTVLVSTFNKHPITTQNRIKPDFNRRLRPGQFNFRSTLRPSNLGKPHTFYIRFRFNPQVATSTRYNFRLVFVRN